ncbi:hypothetical protein VTK56DRAFT_5520 [Thermocarpiscus australiensis]
MSCFRPRITEASATAHIRAGLAVLDEEFRFFFEPQMQVPYGSNPLEARYRFWLRELSRQNTRTVRDTNCVGTRPSLNLSGNE